MFNDELQTHFIEQLLYILELQLIVNLPKVYLVEQTAYSAELKVNAIELPACTAELQLSAIEQQVSYIE